MRWHSFLSQRPILFLLLACLLLGAFTFRAYGLAWDEPLFYKYADALGYAYTPANWFSGHFDLNQSYGPSGSDHKNRGPAYLLLARQAVYLLEKLNLDPPSAWHLVNFLTFLLGVYFVYRLAARFVRPWAALGASALFAFQPLLWGHAFINPKDIPFLTFFAGSLHFGFEMADALARRAPRAPGRLLLAGLFLGLTTSIRVLGPLAGLLVLVYSIARSPTRRTVLWMGLYVLLAALLALATWPYLWENPPLRFAQAFGFMSENPTVLSVLFYDQTYRAYELPRRYLPFYLFFTLSEPVWPLFGLGLLAACRKLKRHPLPTLLAALLLTWFALPFLYVIWRCPPMYDGMRHFLFILPPLFIFSAFAFDFLLERIPSLWPYVFLIVLLLAPGLSGMIQLHPYEYAYYNAFLGGTRGAFRHFETEYWLTCYKEAVEQFNRTISTPVNLYVHREAYIAAIYAADHVRVLEEREARSQITSGDFILINTRLNEDRRTFRDAPIFLRVGRGGADFCVIKRIP